MSGQERCGTAHGGANSCHGCTVSRTRLHEALLVNGKDGLQNTVDQLRRAAGVGGGGLTLVQCLHEPRAFSLRR